MGTETLVARTSPEATAQEVTQKLRQALELLERATLLSPPRLQPQPQATAPVTEAGVRKILAARRQRAEHFPDDLFADPAWDILLELYAAELGQRRMPVTSLCIGAAVPATTALRWIGTLETRNLLVRRPDPMDARRFFVSLTDRARCSIEDYFRRFPVKLG